MYAQLTLTHTHILKQTITESVQANELNSNVLKIHDDDDDDESRFCLRSMPHKQVVVYYFFFLRNELHVPLPTDFALVVFVRRQILVCCSNAVKSIKIFLCSVQRAACSIQASIEELLVCVCVYVCASAFYHMPWRSIESYIKSQGP